LGGGFIPEEIGPEVTTGLIAPIFTPEEMPEEIPEEMPDDFLVVVFLVVVALSLEEIGGVAGINPSSPKVPKIAGPPDE
jgi:hypothetical protein